MVMRKWLNIGKKESDYSDGDDPEETDDSDNEGE